MTDTGWVMGVLEYCLGDFSLSSRILSLPIGILGQQSPRISLWIMMSFLLITCSEESQMVEFWWYPSNRCYYHVTNSNFRKIAKSLGDVRCTPFPYPGLLSIVTFYNIISLSLSKFCGSYQIDMHSELALLLCILFTTAL